MTNKSVASTKFANISLCSALSADLRATECTQGTCTTILDNIAPRPIIAMARISPGSMGLLVVGSPPFPRLLNLVSVVKVTISSVDSRHYKYGFFSCYMIQILGRWRKLRKHLKLLVTNREEGDIDWALSPISASMDIPSGYSLTENLGSNACLDASSDMCTFLEGRFFPQSLCGHTRPDSQNLCVLSCSTCRWAPSKLGILYHSSVGHPVRTRIQCVCVGKCFALLLN
jgi:hypothetical protein